MGLGHLKILSEVYRSRQDSNPYCKVKDASVPLLHKVRISSIHVLCGRLTSIVLWSNPVNYGEMQCWDSVSQIFTPGFPWGCLLGMTKIYWNREKMFKSEGKLAYPNASLPCFVSSSWISGLLFFPTNLCFVKNLWLHNNQLTSVLPAGQTQQYINTLVPNSLHIIFLQFLFIITILFTVFYFFLQVGIWFKQKPYGETARTAASH